MKLNLTLLTIKKFTGKDGTEKAKLIFMSENDKVYVGYADDDQITPEIEGHVTDSNTFDPNRAHTWEVEQDVWNDKLTYRVVIS